MDPLSVAASVIALLTLTETVLTSCYRYAGRVNNFNAEVDKVVREVGSLKIILIDLQEVVENGRHSTLSSLAGENGAFAECRRLLDELKAKLSPAGAPKLRRRLLWPLEAKKVEEVLGQIHKQKDVISSALAVDSLRGVDSIQKGMEDAELRKEKERILNWLKGTDSAPKHLASRRLHQPGSNNWILESASFKEWQEASGQLLWLHGIPGAGKTILCSTIIDHILDICDEQPEKRLAYYYFDFSNASGLRLQMLLRSLILQLSNQRDVLSDRVRYLFEQCDRGRREADDEVLATTLFDMLDDEPAFIIIDALDECPTTERSWFYELITDNIGGRSNFLVTSRKEIDIEEAILEAGERAKLHNIPILSGDVDADIRLHVHQSILNHKKYKRLRNWSEELRKEIEETLVSGAHGMFRWAVCQLDLIKDCMQAIAVREKLKDLPKTLEGTYDRILASIPESNAHIARAALIFLAYSIRPITLQELAEAMVIDVDRQRFEPADYRLNDPSDVLEICSSLVTVTKVSQHTIEALVEKSRIERSLSYHEDVELIQFAHFSVKEYMMQERTTNSLSSFKFSAQLAHQHITKSTLIYLLDFSKGARIDSYSVEFCQRFPFLAYSARYWSEHWICQLSSDQTVVDLLLHRFFDPAQPTTYMNFLNFFDPDHLVDNKSPFFSMYSRGRNTEAFPEPLYYTARLGHLELSRWLLGDKKCNPNSAKGRFGTPLQIAARLGHEEVVDVLLKNGADANFISGEYGVALQAAAYGGFNNVCRILLEHRADVHIYGGEYGTALIAACAGGHISTAKTLLDAGIDINYFSSNHGKALNSASASGNDDLVDLLLQRGANINDSCNNYGTALYSAANDGVLSTVKLLVKRGADVNAVSGYRCTPLQAACSRNSMSGSQERREENLRGYEVAKFLIENGADCNITGGEYGNALQACVEAGNVASSMETLQLLLDHGADIHYRGGKYKSAIEAACYTGNVEAAHVLLDRGVLVTDEVLLHAIDSRRETILPRLFKQGVNVNAQNKDGTALQLAIKSKDTTSITALLGDESLDIDALGGKPGATALYSAVASKNLELAVLLLSRGANVNAQGGDCGNCLCVAVNNKHEEMIDWLLANGADVNLHGTKYYGTPLISAANNREGYNIVKLLLENGADVNERGGGISDALQCAAEQGNIEIVQLLLKSGADFKSIEGSSGSCLECAIKSQNIELVQILLDQGANVNFSRPEKDKEEGDFGFGGALSTAIRLGQNSLYQSLIDRGADVNANTSNFYGSVLQVAIHWGDLEAVRLLLKNGADINKAGGYNGCPLSDAILTTSYSESAAILEEVFEAGADVNLQGGTFGCPLGAAVNKSNLKLVKRLLTEGANINNEAGDHGSVLRLAVNSDIEVFRLLLENEADVNFPSSEGFALAFAAGRGFNIMLKELLDRGADPSQGESEALLEAASSGNIEAMILLLDGGADPHCQKGIPGNALIQAAKYGKVKACELLLDKGVDVNSVGGPFGNALQAVLSDLWLGRKNKVKPMFSLLMSRGADVNLPPSEKYAGALHAALTQEDSYYFEEILAAGADVNAHCDNGTALTEAARFRVTTHVEALLAKGADPALGCKKFGPPLSMAAYYHRNANVNLLLDHGVDVNQAGGRWGPALHTACHNSDGEETLKLLIKRGADVNKRGGKYETAICCAAKHGNLRCVQILLENGADPTITGGKYESPVKAALAKNHYHVANYLKRYMANAPASLSV